MIETNLRIVSPGPGLVVPVRRAIVQSSVYSNDSMEKACSFLQRKRGVAAKPKGEGSNELVVLSAEPFETARLEDENLVLTVSDAGDSDLALNLADDDGFRRIPGLLERALLARVANGTNLWRLDSPRKWLESTPFQTQDGVCAYRRFEISSLAIAGVGAAISVDMSTAFLTSESLASFYDSSLPRDVLKEKLRVFERLTSRQKGQKGTLVNDNGVTQTVCYFEKWDRDRTCGTTPEIRINGKTYPSLYHYYLTNYPRLNIGREDATVMVSFKGIDKPVWVAAKLLRIRVMNDSVPDSLSSVDKISPADRCRMIQGFWASISETPFGATGLSLIPGFWQPRRDQVFTVTMPAIEFGKSRILSTPPRASQVDYKTYFRQRGECLDKSGCYHVPPATPRVIHFAYANGGATAAKQLADDVAQCLQKWTAIPFSTSGVAYNSITDATARLRGSTTPGTVLVVLDEQPASYYECAFQLQGWRLKRVTTGSLRRHHKYLTDGAWDRRERKITAQKGAQKWEQYVTMNAYDVLQQMDGIPFRVPSLGKYEGVVAIDVGHDRRYIAISLLIARDADKGPSFRIVTDVHPKTDPKQDTINPVILADMIVQLFSKVFRGKFDALSSLVVLRDGDFIGQERQGVATALMRLKEKKILETDSITTLGALHKTSMKNIRLWDRGPNGMIMNPLEGTVVYLTPNMSVATTTGAGTLTQGTAEPLMVTCEGGPESLAGVTEAVVIAAQLNWSSPTVAQRLPVAFKRTDDELQIRAAQEIRRIA